MGPFMLNSHPPPSFHFTWITSFATQTWYLLIKSDPSSANFQLTNSYKIQTIGWSHFGYTMLLKRFSTDLIVSQIKEKFNPKISSFSLFFNIPVSGVFSVGKGILRNMDLLVSLWWQYKSIFRQKRGLIFWLIKIECQTVNHSMRSIVSKFPLFCFVDICMEYCLNYILWSI